jgi:probable HAF family extracellular repeat protein
MVLSESGQALTQYTTIDFPGASGTVAWGINTGGQLVGTFFFSDNVSHGFLLSDGVFTQLDVPGADYTQATGINDSGQITGLYGSASAIHGFLLSGGDYSPIHMPGASVTEGFGINNGGVIVGSATPNGSHNSVGFVLSGGVFTKLRDPKSPFERTWALGINNQREVVGFYDSAANEVAGYLFRRGRFRDIRSFKWANIWPYGINDNDRIVGVASTQNGRLHGFSFKKGCGFTIIDIAGVGSTIVMGINSRGQKVGEYQDKTGTHGFLKR